MAMSDSLRKYLTSESVRQLLEADDVTRFLVNSFTLISDTDYRDLLNFLMLRYDDIFGEIHILVAGMFMECDNVSIVSLDSAIETIPSQCFEKSNIKKLSASGVKMISSRAFANCSNLENVSIPNVEIIGSSAFANCTSLKSITLPSSVTRIGLRAFNGCTSLKEIKYEGTVEEASQIKFGPTWDGSFDSSNIKIICTDGEL